MIKKSKLSAQIIGQLSSMQALVSKLDNEETIMSFICKGFLDIPGISNVVFKPFSDENINEYDYTLEISHNNYKHYSLFINFSDPNIVKHYIPYLENFCVVIGVILEERKLRQINEKFSVTLENKVQMRTLELKTEIEKREKIEQSLRFSEQQLKFALSASKSGIFDWNLIDDSVFFDDNYYYLAGYQPGDFPHHFSEWEKRVHPDDISNSLKRLDDYLKGNSSEFSTEFRFKCKDGSWKWILGQGQFYSYKANKPERFIGTHIDISSLKNVEQNLTHSKEFLSAVIDSITSIIIGINENLYINQWNKQASANFGITKSEALNRPIFEILHEDNLLSKTILESLGTEEIKNINRRKYNRNSEERFEDITIYPLKTDNMLGAVIRIDDITEKVILENKIIQNEKMLSISGLAAGTAHEINNPLAAIIQVSNVISNRLYKKIDQPLNKQAASEVGISLVSLKKYIEKRDIPKMLDSIIDAGLRISEIVTDLLSFTTNGNNITSTQSITNILDKALLLADRDYILKTQYNFNKITINKHYAENLPLITCNEVKIEQVFLNIIRNGTQEMFASKIPDPVFDFFINYDSTNRKIIIQIKDNGFGMTEEVKKRIFEPFFTTKEVGTGTGLGLSISYFIITDSHHGEFYVDSKVGSGSTFIIKLPLNGYVKRIEQ